LGSWRGDGDSAGAVVGSPRSASRREVRRGEGEVRLLPGEGNPTAGDAA